MAGIMEALTELEEEDGPEAADRVFDWCVSKWKRKQSSRPKG